MESTDLNIRTDRDTKAADEDVMAISKRLIDKNEQAYEKLAV